MPIPVVSSLDKSVVYEKGTTSIIYLSNCISGDYKAEKEVVSVLHLSLSKWSLGPNSSTCYKSISSFASV